MNKNIWKDTIEFQIYLDKYGSIAGKKTLSKYKKKFGDIDIKKWSSLAGYYKLIFGSSKLLNIDEYLNAKKTKKKKKVKRYKKKENSIKRYREYMKSSIWKKKRFRFIIKYKFTCQCCLEKFPDKSLSLHHHTYERISKERDSDLVLVCVDCHANIHFKNGNRVKLNEKILRDRFKELQLYKYSSVSL